MNDFGARLLLRLVIKNANDPYAKAYATAGLAMAGKELKVQVLYVLSNLQYWRGSQAKEVKKKLKEYVKEMI